MRRSILSLCLAFVAALAVQAAADDSSLQPVEALARDFSAAFNAGDAEGVASLFTEDGIFVAVDGRIHHGRAEIRAYQQTSFERGTKDHAVVVTESHQLGDSVYAIGTVGFSVPAKNGTRMKLGGSWTAIDVPEGGRWRIKLLFASAPPPRPAQ